MMVADPEMDARLLHYFNREKSKDWKIRIAIAGRAGGIYHPYEPFLRQVDDWQDEDFEDMAPVNR